MSNDYGCKRATKRIHKKFLPFMKKLGIRDVYEVPIRKNGMTSSGHMNRCHTNVCKLQVTYGGKVASGFLLHKEKVVQLTPAQHEHYSQEQKSFASVEWICIPHSVWMTPEGKLVNVTQDRPELGDRTSVLFAPLHFTDARKEYWQLLAEYYIPKNYRKNGVWVVTSSFSKEKAEEIANKYPAGRVVISQSAVLPDTTRTKFLADPDTLIEEINSFIVSSDQGRFLDADDFDLDNLIGGFTEPSTATGKSWDEIWRRTCETL
jgi:hypothetical protein